jgi:LPPG:FO 2-phospho-L-lactate transferase
MRTLVREAGVPIVAVSPIIAGQAVRGPAARMLEGLGMPVSVVGVASMYRDLAPILVIDETDSDLADDVAAAGATPVVAPILMRSAEDRRALARLVLSLAGGGASHSQAAVTDRAAPSGGRE